MVEGDRVTQRPSRHCRRTKPTANTSASPSSRRAGGAASRALTIACSGSSPGKPCARGEGLREGVPDPAVPGDDRGRGAGSHMVARTGDYMEIDTQAGLRTGEPRLAGAVKHPRQESGMTHAEQRLRRSVSRPPSSARCRGRTIVTDLIADESSGRRREYRPADGAAPSGSVVALQENAGLDVVTDGEWWRKSYIGVIAELGPRLRARHEPGRRPALDVVVDKLSPKKPGFIARKSSS